MKLQIDEHDAERFGCAPLLMFDLVDVTIAHIDELAERFGFDPDNWPRPLFGYDPDAEPKFRAPRWQRRAVLWLALNLNGHEVSWDEAGRARAAGVKWHLDGEPEPEVVTDG